MDQGGLTLIQIIIFQNPEVKGMNLDWAVPG